MNLSDQNLSDQNQIIALLKNHNLWAKKSFGQNFLIDESALQTIIETAEINPTDHIIEIGPGLGVLTNELAKKAKQVQTIELDTSLLPILEETLNGHKNIEIINQDALTFTPGVESYKVVANIPYNITSPLINHFLQTENKPKSLTLLVQKEVAEKATQIEPKMSILSLQIALFAKATLIKTIPASSFHPAPKVDSAIIKIELYTPNNPNFTDTPTAQKILRLAKAAFSQKRKKLKNTIGQLFDPPDAQNPPIDLSRRPETLSVEEWKKLHSHLYPSPLQSAQ